MGASGPKGELSSVLAEWSDRNGLSVQVRLEYSVCSGTKPAKYSKVQTRVRQWNEFSESIKESPRCGIRAGAGQLFLGDDISRSNVPRARGQAIGFLSAQTVSMFSTL